MSIVTRVVANRSVLLGPRTQRPLHFIPSFPGNLSAAKIFTQRVSAAKMEDPRTMEKDTPMQKEQQEFPGNVCTRASGVSCLYPKEFNCQT